jgi:hypothetical protein
LATILSLLVAVLGGRKEAEVAGRLGMYDVAGVLAIRAVEAARPVTVAGRFRAAVWDDFFAEPAVGVGVILCACPREGARRAGCFGRRGAISCSARVRWTLGHVHL